MTSRLFSNARWYLGIAKSLVPYPVWAVSIVVFTNDNLIESMSIEGRSMSPTLSPEYHDTGSMDYVLFRKYAPTADLKRGDVVSFWTPHRKEHLAVKRIVALEGDTVYLDPKRRPRDDTPQGEKAARDWDIMGHWDWEGSERIKSTNMNRPKVRVPYGHVWVEGDNWRDSADSNYYGPVSKSLISGKALCLYWPFNRAGTRPWEKVPNATKVKQGKVLIPIHWQD